MAATETTAEPVAPEEKPPTALWEALTYWGANLWVLGYVGVLCGAFFMQFGKGEFPCPLCMLQRYGMVLSTLGALWIIMQARRGELTPRRYAQGLGMGIVGAVAGAAVSTRQILIHILPGDPGYGEPVMGMHLYTWAFITFVCVILYCGVALMLAPRGIPVAPTGGAATISTVIVWIFLIVLVANVIAIIFLEGFALVLPDDPNGYNLLHQFGMS